MRWNMFSVVKWSIMCLVKINVFLIVMGNGLDRNNTCFRVDEALTCDYDLPEPSDIPDGISAVYITDFKLLRLRKRNHVFRHTKWKSIKQLDIVAKREQPFFDLEDNDLQDLPQLESLRITSNTLNDVASSAFVGLYNLSYLEFTGCPALESRHVIHALANKNNTFRLNYLKLDNIDNIYNRVIKFDQVFYNMLYDRAVLHLSLCWNTIILIDYLSFKAPLQMQSLDASNSIFSVIQDRSFTNRTHFLLSNLRQCNFSRVIYGKGLINLGTSPTCVKSFPLLETLDTSYVFTPNVIIPKGINIRCFTSFRRWYLHSNSITILNSTILWPKFMDMLDLSWNGMEWLSAKAIDGLVVLKTLNLSNNYLFKMEQRLEFKILFLNLHEMEIINLNNNSFTHIPRNLFKTNYNLKHIILSDNRLETFDLNIRHLYGLEFLDLQKNLIFYIEGFQTQHLGELIHRNLKNKTMNRVLIVNLKNNMFVCSCENLKFINWVKTDLQPTYNDTYKCIFEENFINIDNLALKKILCLCYRTIIIIGSIISTSFVILIAGISMLMCYRKRKSKQRRNIEEHFVDQMMNGQCDEKYLTFLSFCNEDILMSINEVEPALKTHMKDRFNIPEQFIVTGDSTFNVGFPILNEIMRCIKASCVIVCLISQSYCNSQWCQTELREAVEQDKPVILLFLEDVKRQNMSETLWTLFNRNTRSKLVLKDGTFQPIAGWDNLCKSIVNLASNKHYMTKTNKFKKRKRNESIDSEEEITFI